MRIVALLALVTLISGAYEMAFYGIGRPHMLVSILHVTAGSATLVIALYSILYPRRLP